MLPLSWGLLQKVFTVEILMTSPVETWDRNGTKPLSEVRDEFKNKRFDLIPVAEGGRIFGVLPTYSTTIEPALLTEDWKISQNNAIPDMLSQFVDSGHPGLFAVHNDVVVGLVTPADLNKLQARVYWYVLIGEFELALFNWINRFFDADSEKILSYLSDDRRTKIIQEQKEQGKENVDIEAVHLLSLPDLINIAVKQERFLRMLDFSSTAASNKLNPLVHSVRNPTMHMVNPLLKRLPDDLLKLHERVQLVKMILRTLESQ